MYRQDVYHQASHLRFSSPLSPKSTFCAVILLRLVSRSKHPLPFASSHQLRNLLRPLDSDVSKLYRIGLLIDWLKQKRRPPRSVLGWRIFSSPDPTFRKRLDPSSASFTGCTRPRISLHISILQGITSETPESNSRPSMLSSPSRSTQNSRHCVLGCLVLLHN